MGAVKSQCCSVVSAGSGAVSPKASLKSPKLREGSPVTAEDIQRIAKAVEKRLPKPNRKSQAAELQFLRRFIKDRYSSAGDAFDQLFNGQLVDEEISKLFNDGGFKAMFKTQRVDQNTFEKCFVAAGYPGNALLLFDLLKDTDDFMTRSCFKFCLEESPESPKTNTNPNARGDDEPPKAQNSSQSLGSASTTDTAPPKAQIVDANVPGLSSPRKLQSMSVESGIATDTAPPQKLRRLDLFRPPPLQDLSPGSSVKGKSMLGLDKAQSEVSIPKTPARPKGSDLLYYKGN